MVPGLADRYIVSRLLAFRHWQIDVQEVSHGDGLQWH